MRMNFGEGTVSLVLLSAYVANMETMMQYYYVDMTYQRVARLYTMVKRLQQLKWFSITIAKAMTTQLLRLTMVQMYV